MDVILTECNLSLHEITSVFQSAVIFMSCKIMEFKICIFRQHFFVNANFIKHNRHFMPKCFLLDPFEFPCYFYRIRGKLIYVLSIVLCIPSGAFNKFPDFLYTNFKIVVDSGKFGMLLLYMLWDDGPIFMISASNKQLQQQLEYTRQKPDCLCWWSLKIQCGCEVTFEERYAIEFCFKLGKTATETYEMPQTAFRPSCLNRVSVFEWYMRFKEARKSVRDGERCGRCKEVNTPELIGQRVRIMLWFYGSSRRGYVGRGQHPSNRLSGISTRTMHQSATPSLSQTIRARWASRQFLTLPNVQTWLPGTFGYSPSSAVVMRQLCR